jgi:hypothetical protein
VLIPALAEITLNRDAVIWLGGPPLASIAVLIAGLLVRRHSPRTGLALLAVGVIGLAASAAWVAFIFYVDAVLGDT